jgi:hypothetical protein
LDIAHNGRNARRRWIERANGFRVEEKKILELQKHRPAQGVVIRLRFARKVTRREGVPFMLCFQGCVQVGLGR